jgi:hypothetical protein
MIKVSQAILSLIPNAKFGITDNDYSTLEWSKENISSKPSREEVEAEIIRLQAEYEYNQYQRNRAIAYPSIQDQLDALYHQGYDGWKAMVDEVKNKYPKPGEDL